jgi:CDP-diacylglycerol--serine O-phosphatidyltransferase
MLGERRQQRRAVLSAIPHALTGIRATIGVGLVLGLSSVLLHPVSLATVAATDGLDGRIARALGSQSRFGAAFDLAADGLFFLGADLALWRVGRLPGIWLLAILAAALPQILAQAILARRGSGTGSLGLKIDKLLGAYSYLFVVALAGGAPALWLCVGQVSLQITANLADLALVFGRRERRT